MTEVKFQRGHQFALLISLSSLLFAGCSTQGDFGRDRPSVFRDEILPSIRNYVAESNGEPVTRFALTDKERLLRNYRRRIGRDMSFPTVESYFTSTVASMGLTKTPQPHLGEELRSYENSRKPVVEVLENAKSNPYALKSEIDEDIKIIRRVSELSQLIIAEDELRVKRLNTIQSLQQVDRDNVLVRAKENLSGIKYIQHVAKLRVKRYQRAIDVMSIADPTLKLQQVRTALSRLEIEIDQFSIQQRRPRKIRPVVLTKSV